jgi:hypothetical protein
VLGQFKPKALCDIALPLLDDLIVKFDDLAALQTDNMIVVATLIQFKDGLSSFEVVALDKTRQLELSQNPVDRGKANLLAGTQQVLVNILGCHMQVTMRLQHIEDFHARQRNLQTSLF